MLESCKGTILLPPLPNGTCPHVQTVFKVQTPFCSSTSYGEVKFWDIQDWNPQFVSSQPPTHKRYYTWTSGHKVEVLQTQIESNKDLTHFNRLLKIFHCFKNHQIPVAEYCSTYPHLKNFLNIVVPIHTPKKKKTQRTLFR